VPPRVSIGVPVYNGERHLPAALDSLLAQTCREFELIISDNASTDGTSEICRAYAARDARIRYHRIEQNRGSAWNFNRVVELSMAPCFTWAAHDDVRAPGHLDRCIALLDREPNAVLAFTHGWFISDEGARLREFHPSPDLGASSAHERLRQWFFAPHIPYHALFGVMRADVLRRTPLMANCEANDDILLTHLALLGPWAESREPLFYNRDHPERASRSRRGEELAVWFDPANVGKPPAPLTKRMMFQLAALKSSCLPAAEKVRCGGLMLRWGAWRSSAITQELVMTMRHHAVRLMK